MNMEALTGNLSSSQKDELIESVKQQIAIANAQELLTVRYLYCDLTGIDLARPYYFVMEIL